MQTHFWCRYIKQNIHAYCTHCFLINNQRGEEWTLILRLLILHGIWKYLHTHTQKVSLPYLQLYNYLRRPFCDCSQRGKQPDRHICLGFVGVDNSADRMSRSFQVFIFSYFPPVLMHWLNRNCITINLIIFTTLRSDPVKANGVKSQSF